LARAVPYIGGIIQGGIADYYTERRWERVDKFFKMLTAKISELEIDIAETNKKNKMLEEKITAFDKEYVKSEEFMDFFLSIVDQFTRTNEEIRYEFLVGIVISSMKGPDKNLERDFFMRKISEFSIIHLELLRFYQNPKTAYQSKGLSLNNIHSLTLKNLVKEYFSDINEDLWKAAHDELYNAGFLGQETHNFGPFTASSGLTRAYGMLTPLGKRFIDSCIPYRDINETEES